MSATIAARAHSSPTLSAPLKRPQPARRARPRLARFLAAVGRRPGRSFVMLLFSAIACAILLNAMLFQKVRHPAPIASAPNTLTPPARNAERRGEPAPAPAAAIAPAQLPPARPSDLQQAARDATPRPPAPVAPAPRSAAAPQQVAPRQAAARDPIADLINGADIRPPAEIRSVATARSATPRRTAEN